MNKLSAPAMSVILACTDHYASIRLTVQHLRAQTMQHELELVIVAPSVKTLNLDENDLADFWGYQVIEYPPMLSIARANAAGVRRARAGIVALAEDHCFPQAQWAAALIERHREPWAAVGPVILNANPTSIVSWCDYLIGYGFWAEPMPAGEAAILPGHNSSYKRCVLLGYGDALEDMLESETVLHFDLRRKGQRLFLEPAARSAHLNIALLASWLPIQFHNGRVFGGSRARDWPLGKRLFYAAAAPLIPLVRLWRIARELLKPGRPHRLLAPLLPPLFVGLAYDGLGQMMGYLAGAGRSGDKLTRYEFRRIDHVTNKDRAALGLPPLGSHGTEQALGNNNEPA